MTEIELRQKPTVRALALWEVKAGVSSQLYALFSNISSTKSVSIDRDKIDVCLTNVSSSPCIIVKKS
jgi:hypothetical protein